MFLSPSLDRAPVDKILSNTWQALSRRPRVDPTDLPHASYLTRDRASLALPHWRNPVSSPRHFVFVLSAALSGQ
jgi:hypothetical protein